MSIEPWMYAIGVPVFGLSVLVVILEVLRRLGCFKDNAPRPKPQNSKNQEESEPLGAGDALVRDILDWAYSEWWLHLGGDRSRSLVELTKIFERKLAETGSVKTPYARLQVMMLEAAWTGATTAKEQEAAKNAEKTANQAEWWEVLGVARTEPLSVVEAIYRAKAKLAHPDGSTPDPATMLALNSAIEKARVEKGV